jgi:gas vesicle protein
MRNYDFEGEPYVVIEREEAGIGSFLFGIAVGAGIALLLAPRSGAETRRAIGERARRVTDDVRDRVSDVADSVHAQVDDIRERVSERVDDARAAVRRGQRQVRDAVDAGRAAAHEGRLELERRIAENKAARREASQS